MLDLVARGLLPVWLWRSAPPRRPRDIRSAQDGILARLVEDLALLPVGVRLGLDLLKPGSDLPASFRAAVPVTQYADYAALVARLRAGEADVLFPGRPVALAQTSGTTRGAAAGERYVPQSVALLNHHRAGGSAALARLLAASGTGLLAGRALMLGGSTSLELLDGLPVGDLSGICAARLPAWIAGRYEPGLDIMAERDWQRRLAAMATRCATRDVRLLAGIPSWLLVLLRAVAAVAGTTTARDAWPRLGGVVHGGTAIEPFLPALAEHLDQSTRMIEVYSASEAFIAIGSRAWSLGEGTAPDLELLTAHGVYLEFLPEGGEDDTAVGAEAIEAGGLYRVLVTTPGGLVRYQVGDLVLGQGPGRVRFAGRIATRLSVFGEHVEGHALAGALAEASGAAGAVVEHYHVAPLLPYPGEPRGRHEWWIEFRTPPNDLARFVGIIDRHLCAAVLDYAAHRQGDAQLLPPLVRAVPAGTFHAFLAARGRLGDQHKVPQAWPDHSIADALAGCARGLTPVPA